MGKLWDNYCICFFIKWTVLYRHRAVSLIMEYTLILFPILGKAESMRHKISSENDLDWWKVIRSKLLGFLYIYSICQTPVCL